MKIDNINVNVRGSLYSKICRCAVAHLYIGFNPTKSGLGNENAPGRSPAEWPLWHYKTAPQGSVRLAVTVNTGSLTDSFYTMRVVQKVAIGELLAISVGKEGSKLRGP